MSDRPETGVMVFGDDWPGIFIRGDNCFSYKGSLEDVLEKVRNPEKQFEGETLVSAIFELEELLKLLDSSNCGSFEYKKKQGEIQKLKSVEECI